MSVNDDIFSSLEEYGGDTVSERIYNYLGSLGYTGTLSDRLAKFQDTDHKGWQKLITDFVGSVPFEKALFPDSAGSREGAVIKIRPEYLRANKDGTGAVSADGDPVSYILDASVNGHAFALFQTTPATYRTNGTQHWLECLSAGFVSVGKWPFMNNSPYSVGAGIKLNSASASDQYFFGTIPEVTGDSSGPELANSVVHIGARTGTTATIAHWFDDQDFSHTFSTAPERHIAVYRNPGSEYTINGTQIDISATTPSQLDNVGEVTLMLREPEDITHSYLNGNLYGMVIVIDTISAQERSDIDAWLTEQIPA